jgi:hypothetical protein
VYFVPIYPAPQAIGALYIVDGEHNVGCVVVELPLVAVEEEL